MAKEKCLYCGPLAKNHFISWLDDLLEWLITKLESFLIGSQDQRRQKIFQWLGDKIFNIFIFIFNKLKIAEYVEIGVANRCNIYNRTLVVIDEAIKRGVKIKALVVGGRFNNQFLAEVSGRKIFFEGLPLGRAPRKAESLYIDDKAKIKEILKRNNLPAVEGRSFFWSKRACQYGLKLDFPLVAKPRWGSVSRHVFIDITSEQQLKEAIKNVKRICPWVVIERYLKDVEVFRVTTIDKKIGGAVKRLPANVVGDGRRTIRELIVIKNSHPWRGRAGQKDCTYLKIVINQETDNLLRTQGYDLNSVLPDGRLVFLQRKIILDLGADLIEVTSLIHPDNQALFEKIARIFDASVLGIDFLCSDIAVSWQEQNCGIIELNSLPFIDMHHFPLAGEPRNIAAMIWDMVEQKKEA